MSSRQFEDMLEQQQDEGLARELGITAEELQDLEYDIDAHASKDDLLYGYNVTFLEGCDPDVLAKIKGSEAGWVRIGPY